MTLSVLILTIEKRKHLFDELMIKLNTLAQPYDVEILSCSDNGERSKGTKRNELVDQAKGKLSCFIDDDDDIPEYYFEDIFKVLAEAPLTDCIGFKGILSYPRSQPPDELFKHSVELPYSDGKINNVYLRPPNHLNPMLTEYFRQIRFPEINFAEDYNFAIELQKAGLIKNHVYLDKVMYYYRYNPRKR